MEHPQCPFAAGDNRHHYVLVTEDERELFSAPHQGMSAWRTGFSGGRKDYISWKFFTPLPVIALAATTAGGACSAAELVAAAGR